MVGGVCAATTGAQQKNSQHAGVVMQNAHALAAKGTANSPIVKLLRFETV
jgi:hypothetical protein